MEKLFRINKQIENSFILNADVKGSIPKQDMEVRIVIKNTDMSYIFQCERENEDEFSIVFPPMPFLKSKSYECYVEVLVDNYYFRPVSGFVDIVSEEEEKPQITITLKKAEEEPGLDKVVRDIISQHEEPPMDTLEISLEEEKENPGNELVLVVEKIADKPELPAEVKQIQESINPKQNKQAAIKEIIDTAKRKKYKISLKK